MEADILGIGPLSETSDLSLAMFSQYGPYAWLITKDMYCIFCDNS